MGLVKCPECGEAVSEQALACPHCGFPIAEADLGQRDPSGDTRETGESGPGAAVDRTVDEESDLGSGPPTPSGKTSRAVEVVFRVIAMTAAIVVWVVVFALTDLLLLQKLPPGIHALAGFATVLFVAPLMAVLARSAILRMFGIDSESPSPLRRKRDR